MTCRAGGLIPSSSSPQIKVSLGETLNPKLSLMFPSCSLLGNSFSQFYSRHLPLAHSGMLGTRWGQGLPQQPLRLLDWRWGSHILTASSKTQAVVRQQVVTEFKVSLVLLYQLWFCLFYQTAWIQMKTCWHKHTKILFTRGKAECEMKRKIQLQ